MPGRQQRRGIEAYDRYVRFSQAPMTALAFLMIPVLLIPLIRPVHGVVAVSFDAADYVIWILFAVDYGVRFRLAPDRPRFVRTHLLDLAVVVLPFLRRCAPCAHCAASANCARCGCCRRPAWRRSRAPGSRRLATGASLCRASGGSPVRVELTRSRLRRSWRGPACGRRARRGS
jgi:hypothetical protein